MNTPLTGMRNQLLRYEDIIGQRDVVARLNDFGRFATTTGGSAGHILLTGEEGMGKHTIASIFASELRVSFQETDAAKIEAQGDLTAILTNLREKQVLLLSNIQLLRKAYRNRLDEVLRDFRLQITIGTGPAARDHIMEVRPFTLVAICPKKSDCPAELLSEFSLSLNLQPYSIDDLRLIAESIAKRSGIALELGASVLLARNCDGRPGHLDAMLRRFARALNNKVITEQDLLRAFTAFGINVRSENSTNEARSLRDLSGQDFERLITSLLTRMGFLAEMTKTSGDGGIDIVAESPLPIFAGRYLFQCKRFAPDNLVGAPTVRDFYGAVTADRAVKGIFITTSDFTVQAREFGQRVGIELIGLKQLQKLFAEYGLTELLDE